MWENRLHGETLQPTIIQYAIYVAYVAIPYTEVFVQRGCSQRLTGGGGGRLQDALPGLGWWINRHFLAPILFHPLRTQQPREKLCLRYEKSPAGAQYCSRQQQPLGSEVGRLTSENSRWSRGMWMDNNSNCILRTNLMIRWFRSIMFFSDTNRLMREKLLSSALFR